MDKSEADNVADLVEDLSNLLLSHIIADITDLKNVAAIISSKIETDVPNTERAERSALP